MARQVSNEVLTSKYSLGDGVLSLLIMGDAFCRKVNYFTLFAFYVKKRSLDLSSSCFVGLQCFTVSVKAEVHQCF